jgi:hypothetical protein
MTAASTSGEGRSTRLGSVRARANGPVWPAAAPPVGFGTSGGGGLDGLRVLRLRGGGGAAGAHCPGLPPVPLPRLRQAVQRAQRRGAQPGAVPLRRDCSRGALAPALPPDPARSGRDVSRARPGVRSRSRPGVGGEARAGAGR